MDQHQALQVAREIAAAAGDGDSRLEPITSRSSRVFLSTSAVIKLADHGEPGRFAREVALAADLPAGLSAPILDHGRWTVEGAGSVQYVRIGRLPGASPVMGLPSTDRQTALLWARQAVAKLQRLHLWKPNVASRLVLNESLDHGGFTTRDRLLQDIGALQAVDRARLTPGAVLDGLRDIADAAPEQALASVPVHADCHWGNWLIDGGEITALLDFEWARFGEPVDDWFFLARFSGVHMLAVLRAIADAAGTSMNDLRGACEVREAAYLVSDLLLALQNPRDPDRLEALELLPDLVELSVHRAWHQPER